jgi:hypothetical protein
MRRLTKWSKTDRPSRDAAGAAGPPPVTATAPAAPAEGESYFWGLRPGRPTQGARPVGWYPSEAGAGQEDYWDGRSWTGRRQAIDGGWAVLSMNATPAPAPARPPAATAPLPADAAPLATGPVLAPPGAEIARGFPGASAPTRLSPGESYYYGLRPGRTVTTGRPVGWYPSGGNDSGQEDFWDGRSWTARRQLVNGGWAAVPMS